jgi:hypothetical protein
MEISLTRGRLDNQRLSINRVNAGRSSKNSITKTIVSELEACLTRTLAPVCKEGLQNKLERWPGFIGKTAITPRLTGIERTTAMPTLICVVPDALSAQPVTGSMD